MLYVVAKWPYLVKNVFLIRAIVDCQTVYESLCDWRSSRVPCVKVVPFFRDSHGLNFFFQFLLFNFGHFFSLL